MFSLCFSVPNICYMAEIEYSSLILKDQDIYAQNKPRARDLGIPFEGITGPLNAITDVKGVEVGRKITGLQPIWDNENENIDNSKGSIIVVVATDAPLISNQLKRLAKRVPIGISRVGGFGSNTSGDIFIAFSTANPGAASRTGIQEIKMVHNDQISPLFKATAQATEKAIINALIAAETMTGINGNKIFSLPHDQLKEILRKYNRLNK